MLTGMGCEAHHHVAGCSMQPGMWPFLHSVYDLSHMQKDPKLQHAWLKQACACAA